MKRYIEMEGDLGLDLVAIEQENYGCETLHLHKDGSDVIVYVRDGKFVLQSIGIDVDEWPEDVYDDAGEPVPKTLAHD